MKILGIETSCDETAVAVVKDGREILSNVVVSQIDIFAEYGGVIPEVAARSHLEVMMPVIDKALTDASCGWDDIDAIAVTHAPGLLGSLLIGTLTARALAILHNKPLYAVHHLKSHVYANWLDPGKQNSAFSTRSGSEPVLSGTGVAPARRHGRSAPSSSTKSRPLGVASTRNASVSSAQLLQRSVVTSGHPLKEGSRATSASTTRTPVFPLLALVVSGGHTQILYMRGHNQFEIVGTTRDDAVGECFDKVAKILGLPYPGGPSIALAAEDGDANKYRFPHPKIPGLDFSFSGLKTAVLRAVQKEVGVPISYPSHKLAELLSPEQVSDFAASFQKTAVEILLEKLEMALGQFPDTKAVVVAGGVSANEELRARLESGFFSSVTRGEKSLEKKVSNKKVSNSDFSPVALRLYSSKNPDSSLPEIFFPVPSLSGDNGAMVAGAAYFEIQSGMEPTDPYKLNIYPRISIEE